MKRSLQWGKFKINGSRPWDIQIHDERFYKRVLAENTLGLGESYMEGWRDATGHLFVMEDWHNFGQDYDPVMVSIMRTL
ncbi:MAG: hypothetical protein WD599_06000 [Balneolaceae bacterium]